jgi:hypothetical protein
MSAQPEAAKSNQLTTEAAFPSQQSVVMPGAGNGQIGLYLAGGGGSQLAVYYSGGATQVLYGQNFQSPTTPLPTGVTTFPLANGFNMSWQSSGQPFKLVWGVQ